MLTEDEARQKWCPMVRNAAPADSEAGGTAGNRYGGEPNHPANSCIASECMMWRFSQKYDGDFQRRAEAEFARTGRCIQPTRGYCGLSGQPEF